MTQRAGALTMENVTKRFGGLKALSGVTFSISAGTIHSVIGPNGAGKTCLFNCTSGFYQPDDGVIALDGVRVDGLQPNRIARAGIGRTFQNIRLFKSLTVMENMLVAHDTQHDAWRSLWQPQRAPHKITDHDEDACRALLQFVGLEGSEGRLASSMSYGDQRRLEIARVLAIRPRVLMLDEPAAGMNTAESLSLLRLIQNICKTRDTTVVLIEHEMRLVMGVSDRITVLAGGTVLAEGSPAEIRRNDKVIEAYLGTGPAAGVHNFAEPAQ